MTLNLIEKQKFFSFVNMISNKFSGCFIKRLFQYKFNLNIYLYLHWYITDKEDAPEYGSGIRQSSNAKITFNDEEYFQKVRKADVKSQMLENYFFINFLTQN